MAKKTKADAASKWPVRARMPGLYDGHRREGEEFGLKMVEDFAPRWMTAIGWTPAAAAPAKADTDTGSQNKPA